MLYLDHSVFVDYFTHSDTCFYADFFWGGFVFATILLIAYFETFNYFNYFFSWIYIFVKHRIWDCYFSS